MSISTKQWKRAGLPFEAWLRYCQASEDTRRKVEDLFRRKFPKLSQGAQ